MPSIVYEESRTAGIASLAKLANPLVDSATPDELASVYAWAVGEAVSPCSSAAQSAISGPARIWGRSPTATGARMSLKPNGLGGAERADAADSTILAN